MTIIALIVVSINTCWASTATPGTNSNTDSSDFNTKRILWCQNKETIKNCYSSCSRSNTEAAKKRANVEMREHNAHNNLDECRNKCDILQKKCWCSGISEEKKKNLWYCKDLVNSSSADGDSD